MGWDTALLKDPESLSKHLICPICHAIPRDPVETPSEHLYCRDELDEWLNQRNTCPMTKEIIDRGSLRKPSRVILNMLNDLSMICKYREQGCEWIGDLGSLQAHHHRCKFATRNQLQDENEQLRCEVEKLRQRCRAQGDEIRAKDERLLNLESNMKRLSALGSAPRETTSTERTSTILFARPLGNTMTPPHREEWTSSSNVGQPAPGEAASPGLNVLVNYEEKTLHL